jgi:hypothetical protein
VTGNRSKSAWIWVSMVAITLVSVVRTQSGIEHARTYSAPVATFFSGSRLLDSGISASAHRPVVSSQLGISGIAFDLLTIFFVGLIAPLNLLSPQSLLCLGRALPAPDLPHLFQRPPPTLA